MKRFRIGAIGARLAAGLLLALLAALPLPGRSFAKLPPRPTPRPSPTPLPPTPVPGGFIGLEFDPDALPLWARVQWLAGDGRWYDVDGWAGQPDAAGQLRWYVGPSLLGAETRFRWRIFQDGAMDQLIYSVQFQLPGAPSESVIFTLPPPAPQPPP